MPWEKQFSTDDVLSKAMEAFWSHGYEATSMQDLVNCMGINRGSIYATFGDKRALFIQALRRYDTIHRYDWAAAIARSRSPAEAIVGIFEEAIDAALHGGGRSGCLLVNTALELSPHDAEISEIVEHAFSEMEAFFCRKLAEGQACGDVPSDVEPVDTARALLSLFIGLRVLACGRPREQVLRSIAGQAEAMIT